MEASLRRAEERWDYSKVRGIICLSYGMRERGGVLLLVLFFDAVIFLAYICRCI